MNAFNQQMAGNRASTQGLYSLAGAGAKLAGSTYGGDGWSFSDRRLKNNIIKVGELASGLAVYSFNYIWDGGTTIVGVMADEAEKLFPKAVRYTDGGLAQVNYSEIS
jgi:hypothetical protein